MLPIVVPDLHGRSDLLAALVAAHSERQFVLLGDYVDRGPASRAVLSQVRSLVTCGQAVALMGNHDLLMIEVMLGGVPVDLWLRNGGQATLDSYAGQLRQLEQDARWMRAHLLEWYVEGVFLFSHAMRPGGGDPEVHLWGRPVADRRAGGRLASVIHPLGAGLRVSVHGHTPLRGGPLRLAQPDGSSLLFLDTKAYATGVLGCYDCHRRQVILVKGPPQVSGGLVLRQGELLDVGEDWEPALS